MQKIPLRTYLNIPFNVLFEPHLTATIQKFSVIKNHAPMSFCGVCIHFTVHDKSVQSDIHTQ